MFLCGLSHVEPADMDMYYWIIHTTISLYSYVFATMICPQPQYKVHSQCNLSERSMFSACFSDICLTKGAAFCGSTAFTKVCIYLETYNVVLLLCSELTSCSMFICILVKDQSPW